MMDAVQPLETSLQPLVLPEYAVRLALGAEVGRQNGNMVIRFESDMMLMHESDFEIASKAAKKLKLRVPQQLNTAAVLELAGFAHKYVCEEIFFPGTARVLYFQAPIKASAFWRCMTPAITVSHGTKVKANLVSPRRSIREALEFDVVVFQIGHDRVAQGCAQTLQKMGKKIVWDCDDDYFNLQPWHTGYEIYRHETVKEQLKRMMGLVDAVTVTTPYLRDLYAPFAKRVEILPNYILLGDWPKSDPHGTDEFRVLWAGSPSHGHDLELVAKPLVEFSRRRSNVKLQFFGRMPPKLEPGPRIEYTPLVEFEHYPMKLAELRADIAIAPLADTLFNAGKSAIKILEYSACGYPVIASNVGPYRDTITSWMDGVLCETPQQWLDALEVLYQEEKVRKEITENGFKIAQRFEAAVNAEKIENFFAGLA